MISDFGVSGDYNQHGNYHNRLSDEVRMYISSWAPRKIPHAQWTVVEPFVKEAVVRAGAVSRKRLSQALRIVTMFVLWSRAAGIPLDEEAIFDIDSIERFVRVEHDRVLAKRGEPNRARSFMSLVSNVLTSIAMDVHSDYTIPHPLPQKAQDSSPYLDSDTPWIRTWAAAQPTSDRRRYAHALLGLCRGAGLMKNELMHARKRDVIEDEHGLLIHINGESPRIVPIDPEWAEAMRKGLRPGPEDEYIIYPDWTTRSWTYDRLNGDQPHQRVSAMRLRRTWINERIGTLPVDVLVRAAGFKWVSSLASYAPHIREFHGTELVDAMRGAQ